MGLYTESRSVSYCIRAGDVCQLLYTGGDREGDGRSVDIRSILKILLIRNCFFYIGNLEVQSVSDCSF